MSDEILGDYRYVFRRELKAGGMGVVYLAEDRFFQNRRVAVKVVKTDSNMDPKRLTEMLIKEAHLQHKLSTESDPHPHIVYWMDLRMFDAGPGIVMEYIEGGSLADRMRGSGKRRSLAVEDVVRIVRQICFALEFAHSKGTIHRDIKPSNILIRSSDNIVKLTDWGVAKNTLAGGSGYTYTGTPPYMSPEILKLPQAASWDDLKKAGVDHRTDIYSLGVTIYELLTGKLPFQYAEPDEVIAGVTAKHEQALVAAGVDPAVAAVVMRIMSPDPKNRYQSAADIDRELRAAAGSTTTGTGGERSGVAVDVNPAKGPDKPIDSPSEPPEPSIAADLVSLKERIQKGQVTQHEAEAQFQRLIKETPTSAGIYLEYARYLGVQAHKIEAMKYLNRGIEAVPGSASLWFMRAQLNDERGDRAAATRDYQQAQTLGLSPKDLKYAGNRLRKLTGVTG